MGSVWLRPSQSWGGQAGYWVIQAHLTTPVNNVISLEFSHTKLEHLVKRPTVVGPQLWFPSPVTFPLPFLLEASLHLPMGGGQEGFGNRRRRGEAVMGSDLRVPGARKC